MEDTQFLKELLAVIEQQGDGAYEKVIVEKASYPYLYHLSKMRENLIDWIAVREDAQILERNPECGALTGKLLEMAGAVTCVAADETHEKLLRARGRKNEEKLFVVQETAFQRALPDEKYDVIFIVGAFYRYKEELAQLRTLLKPQGRLIVADANRLGLKFWAGCRDEYRDMYFSGIEGYETEQQEDTKPRCYSKTEYEALLKAAGFGRLRFYYPYPDYVFPHSVYSDAWLPKEGELMDNRRNFKADRLQLFDERKAYDSLLKEGVFPVFSNSYLIEAYEK